MPELPVSVCQDLPGDAGHQAGAYRPLKAKRPVREMYMESHKMKGIGFGGKIDLPVLIRRTGDDGNAFHIR